MTIEDVIRLGDDLKVLTKATEETVFFEKPKSVLPAGCPLYTNVEGAAKLFNISHTTMYRLMVRFPDFPSLKIGKKIVVDVPGLYEWLHMRNGTRVACAEEE